MVLSPLLNYRPHPDHCSQVFLVQRGLTRRLAFLSREFSESIHFFLAPYHPSRTAFISTHHTPEASDDGFSSRVDHDFSSLLCAAEDGVLGLLIHSTRSYPWFGTNSIHLSGLVIAETTHRPSEQFS